MDTSARILFGSEFVDIRGWHALKTMLYSKDEVTYNTDQGKITRKINGNNVTHIGLLISITYNILNNLKIHYSNTNSFLLANKKHTRNEHSIY